jgi:hypothetical protein
VICMGPPGQGRGEQMGEAVELSASPALGTLPGDLASPGGTPLGKASLNILAFAA